MRALAPQLVFLPGFDGAAHLREPFLAALRGHHQTRGIGYPNRPLHTLNGYCRHAAAHLDADARAIVVAESFSGLVAARWASMDPHIEGLVLCGSFARNPMTWMTSLGASVPGLVRFGAGFLRTPQLARPDPVRQRWTRDLSQALRALDDGVIGERLRLIAEEDVRTELRALRIPVLLVQFDDDLVIGPRSRGELEEVCHNAEVIRFPGPHFAIETMPQQCATAIAAGVRTMGSKTTTRRTT
jgi:pimeloyl-ACP methyl ester carboxylesterase